MDFVSLKARKMILNTQLHIELMSKILKDPEIIPITAVKMFQMQQSQGVTAIEQVLFANQRYNYKILWGNSPPSGARFFYRLPRKVIILQIDTDRFRGDYQKNPWFFAFNNYMEVSLTSGNEIFPLGRPFKPDGGTKDANREYLAMLHVTGSLDSQTGRYNCVDFKSFLGGNFTRTDPQNRS